MKNKRKGRVRIGRGSLPGSLNVEGSTPSVHQENTLSIGESTSEVG